jgi:hypothetical protein
MFLYLDCVPSPSESMWFLVRRDCIRDGLDLRSLRGLDRGKLPNRALPVASLQRLPMAFSVQFAVTPDRTGAVRVVLPLLSSRGQEAEHEAQTAVDLDSTNFRSTVLSTAGNGPTYRPYGQASKERTNRPDLDLGASP